MCLLSFTCILSSWIKKKWGKILLNSDFVTVSQLLIGRFREKTVTCEVNVHKLINFHTRSTHEGIHVKW